jgi:hypothetical protein
MAASTSRPARRSGAWKAAEQGAALPAHFTVGVTEDLPLVVPQQQIVAFPADGVLGQQGIFRRRGASIT